MNRAICIGCGCDEEHACPVLGTPVQHYACWWVRFDADANVGVCSACWDLVKAWDAARAHAPILPLIAERYYRQLLFLYQDSAGAVAWMGTPHVMLSGQSPRDLILAGELERVHHLVDLMKSGAFA